MAGTKKKATCSECRREFPSEKDVRVHIIQKMEEGDTHLFCYLCWQHFRTVPGLCQHLSQTHASQQNVACPGCEKKFLRIASLMEHIESGGCKVIGSKKLAAHRDQKLAFARELQSRHRGDHHETKPSEPAKPKPSEATKGTAKGTTKGSGNSSEVPGVKKPAKSTKEPNSQSIHTFRPKAEATVRPNPLQFEARPVSMWTPNYYNGYSTQPDLLTGADEHESVGQEPEGKWDPPDLLTGTDDIEAIGNWCAGQWAQPEVLTPTTSLAAVRPTAEQQQVADTPEAIEGTVFDPHNPQNPDFNPNRYYVPYTQKYKCPYTRCGRSLPTRGGLVSHMNSEAHSRVRYQCPSCFRSFTSITAITQHCESESTSCRIRHSESFRAFLNQLTAGICDLDGLHGADGTNRYVVPEEAARVFGRG